MGVFSRSTAKKAEAEKLGAKLVANPDLEQLKSMARTFHTILDTVSAEHDIMPLVMTLKVDGTFVTTGGVPETAAMLEFCAKHDIKPDIKVIPAVEAAEAYNVLQSGRAPAARHVIDVSTIRDIEEQPAR